MRCRNFEWYSSRIVFGTIFYIPAKLTIIGLAQLMVQADNECDVPCGKKIWDGYGRWRFNNQWKPFMDEVNLPSSSGL